jgi:hypothetical protein
MLGMLRTQPEQTAQTLRMSAQFDSDPTIRAAAVRQLERLAILPPAAFRR